MNLLLDTLERAGGRAAVSGSGASKGVVSTRLPLVSTTT